MNDPEKGKIIDALPSSPSSLKELRKFLGMASWHLRDFAPEYIDLAATITHKFRGLPEKYVFADVWDSEAQAAYDDIKELCRNQLVLATFDPDADDTLLFSDWSKKGIGAVLTQRGRIVAVKGRSCQAAEQRYTPTKGELLAWSQAQLWFRVYLLSLKTGFTCVVDHRPLLGIIRKLDLEIPDLLNIRSKTEEFRHKRKTVYVMGDAQLADHWSRLWPGKELPESKGSVFVVPTTPRAEHDRLEQLGLKTRHSKDRLEVQTHGKWRTYVPISQRSALVDRVDAWTRPLR